jgi:hypothetical protein
MIDKCDHIMRENAFLILLNVNDPYVMEQTASHFREYCGKRKGIYWNENNLSNSDWHSRVTFRIIYLGCNKRTSEPMK